MHLEEDTAVKHNLITYCGFINFHWIPIFVDFVVTGEPRN